MSRENDFKKKLFDEGYKKLASKKDAMGFDKYPSIAKHAKAKSKALAKSKKGSAFERQQKLISKERSEYAKKYPGTYKGRPIHELRKEAMLD